MKQNGLVFIIFAFCLFLTPLQVLAGQDIPAIPVKNTVTMVDLGAKTCIPCKMMAPILEKLEKEYEGRAEIVFIDVWENQPQARKFGVSVIPTQIFFTKKGEEIYRHQGFLDEDAIRKMLEILLEE